MRVKITSVDMYGLNGRDLHPALADIGMVGTVQDCYVDHEGDPDDEMDPLVLFTIEFQDGERLEVAEFEIEVVKDSVEVSSSRSRHHAIVEDQALIDQAEEDTRLSYPGLVAKLAHPTAHVRKGAESRFHELASRRYALLRAEKDQEKADIRSIAKDIRQDSIQDPTRTPMTQEEAEDCARHLRENDAKGMSL